jgi:long-chain acyl-CoA synthetase
MNLAAIIERHAEERPALMLEDGTVVSYGELRRSVAAMRSRLAASRIGPGDRVALLIGNESAFVLAYLGILGIGAVAVPMNPASPPAELERELGQVGVSAVVISGAAWPTGLDVAVVSARDLGSEPAGEETGPHVVDRQPDDLAVLIFTAGTGGSPKPAMLSHGNLLSNLRHLAAGSGQVLPDDLVLGALPFFHIFGLNVVLGGAFYVGAAILLVDHFHAEPVLNLIETRRVTVLCGSPTMYAALAAVPASQSSATGALSVRLAYCGAAPLSAEVAVAWERRFGFPLHQGYGLTEASPAVTRPSADDHPRPGSIGVPLPGVEVRLIDDDGEDSLVGDPGEIWVRGDNVFAGYWGDEQASRDVLTPDGWLRTGDVAVAGDDGQLYIVDRAKDLIIVSGFNVYPAEVEETLGLHPAVAEVAVAGVLDPYRGETVKAFVVTRDGAGTSEEELIRFCSERLVAYKCPTSVTFLPSLPHGLAGKLLRRALLPQPGEA